MAYIWKEIFDQMIIQVFISGFSAKSFLLFSFRFNLTFASTYAGEPEEWQFFCLSQINRA